MRVAQFEDWEGWVGQPCGEAQKIYYSLYVEELTVALCNTRNFHRLVLHQIVNK